jgi:nucleotide-binding universal stress UspA family protein
MAAEMAVIFASDVTLLHVLIPSDPSYSAKEPSNSCDEDSRGENVLCSAIEIMNEFRVMYDTKVMIGHPAELILMLAEEEGDEKGFDLIVLGASGKGMRERFPFGSVSQRVTQNSKRAVLVVP